jgi:hypothetical protein
MLWYEEDPPAENTTHRPLFQILFVGTFLTDAMADWAEIAFAFILR